MTVSVYQPRPKDDNALEIILRGVDLASRIYGQKLDRDALEDYRTKQMALEEKKMQVAQTGVPKEQIVAQEKERDRQLKRELAQQGLDYKREKDKADRAKASLLPANAPKTKAQEAVDRNFAKTYEEYVASGGYADVEKSLSQLEEAAQALSKTDAMGNPQEPLTGSVRGRLPDFVRTFTNPKAVAVKEKVEEVVQRNLRLVLGAQFTEKEGERLISRAYNSALSPEENKARVERLITQIREAAASKEAAAKHYENFGTLAEYKGSDRFKSANDFLADEKKNSAPSRSLLPQATASPLLPRPPQQQQPAAAPAMTPGTIFSQGGVRYRVNEDGKTATEIGK